MKTIEIQNFLLTKGKFLPNGKIEEVSTKLQNIEEGSLAFFKVSSLSFKSPLALTLLYWLVPGFACIDRFFIEGINEGLKKLSILFGLMLFVFVILRGSLFASTLDTFNESDLSYKVLSSLKPILILITFLAVWTWLIIDGIKIYNRVKKQNMNTFNTAIK